MRRTNELIAEMYFAFHNGMSFRNFQANQMPFHMTFKKGLRKLPTFDLRLKETVVQAVFKSLILFLNPEFILVKWFISIWLLIILSMVFLLRPQI